MFKKDEIPLLDVYPGYVNSIIQKNTMHPQIFLAALFTVVKIRKQAKCPSTDKWMEKMSHVFTIYTIKEYYSAIKKNRIVPFSTTGMDLEGIVLLEMRQRKMSTI